MPTGEDCGLDDEDIAAADEDFSWGGPAFAIFLVFGGGFASHAALVCGAVLTGTSGGGGGGSGGQEGVGGGLESQFRFPEVGGGGGCFALHIGLLLSVSDLSGTLGESFVFLGGGGGGCIFGFGFFGGGGGILNLFFLVFLFFFFLTRICAV